MLPLLVNISTFLDFLSQNCQRNFYEHHYTLIESLLNILLIRRRSRGVSRKFKLGTWSSSTARLSIAFSLIFGISQGISGFDFDILAAISISEFFLMILGLAEVGMGWRIIDFSRICCMHPISKTFLNCIYVFHRLPFMQKIPFQPFYLVQCRKSSLKMSKWE